MKQGLCRRQGPTGPAPLLPLPGVPRDCGLAAVHGSSGAQGEEQDQRPLCRAPRAADL